MINYDKIKADIKAALDGSLPTVKEISIDKIVPNQHEDLPSVSIYTLVSSASAISGPVTPPMFQTELAIILDVIVSQNDTFMLELDAIVTRIKSRLFSETVDEWFESNGLDEFINYEFAVTASTEAARETVTGELVITVSVCEEF